MNDSNKHWGFCLSFAFSISTICIPSLELPQPIQTAAILNRATHTRLPTEGHYCVPWPRLSQANNQAVTAELCHCVPWSSTNLWCFSVQYIPPWKHSSTHLSLCRGCRASHSAGWRAPLCSNTNKLQTFFSLSAEKTEHRAYSHSFLAQLKHWSWVYVESVSGYNHSSQKYVSIMHEYNLLPETQHIRFGTCGFEFNHLFRHVEAL